MVQYSIKPQDDNGVLWSINKKTADRLSDNPCKELFKCAKAIFRDYKEKGKVESIPRPKGLEGYTQDFGPKREVFYIKKSYRKYEVIIDCAITNSKDQYEFTIYFDPVDGDDSKNDDTPEQLNDKLKELRDNFKSDLGDLVNWKIGSGSF